MSAPIIGLIGKKRSGKDTFAAVLVEKHEYTRVAFADPLREALLRMDPYVDADLLEHGEVQPYRLSEVIEVLGWERAKDEVPEVRRLLQTFGTDAIRTLDADFWVRAAVASAEAVQGPVVVTDVRFPNEADAIRNMGGLLVRITRPGYDGDGHPTETALDGYPADISIPNTRSINDLQALAESVAQDAPRILALRS